VFSRYVRYRFLGMTGTKHAMDDDLFQCENAGCPNTFPRRKGGAPKRFCSGTCWRSANRTQLLQKQRAYFAANREHSNAMRREWHQTHRDEALPKFRAYYQEHRAEQREKGQAWFAEHRDEDNARRRNHYHAHKDANREGRKVKRYTARIETPWKKLLDSATGRAKLKKVAYTLTPEWAAERWTGRCELTGHPFSVSMDGKPGGRSYSPSIDRIIPALGYVPDNCRFILYGINRFKGEMTDEEMFTMARLLLTTQSPT
jgi:hypothetical protein